MKIVISAGRAMRSALALCLLLLAGCGDSVTVDDPSPSLRVEVAVRYTASCSVEWTATASLPLRVISYQVGTGTLESPIWQDSGTFQGSKTVDVGRAASGVLSVVYILQADGFQREARSEPTGLCAAP